MAEQKKKLPKPFESPLRPHWDFIKALRRQRKRWPQIAQALRDQHQIETSYKTVQNFYRRMAAAEKRVQMGFDAPETQPAPQRAAPHSSPPPADPNAPPAAPANNPVAQARQKAQSFNRDRLRRQMAAPPEKLAPYQPPPPDNP
jgi:hypothetical protein